ncbi:MAG: hypothetical protein LQ343_003868 [Gyalolechia ehrenbergii]|nr:MAG: hypothetical protein LQ343_003868 [Gyalolechia ehrenbergii]
MAHENSGVCGEKSAYDPSKPIQRFQNLISSEGPDATSLSAMPGKEMTVSMGPPTLPNLPSFKAHKVMPKSKTVSTNIGPISATIPRTRKHDLEREGYSSSERIRSWIPEPSSVQAVPDHGLPLTPPLNAAEKVDGIIHGESWSNGLYGASTSTHTANSGIMTPVVKHSPPTPETTPPKVDQRIHMSQESSDPQLPSTRTESFETARENQISDEDIDRPNSPWLRPARQNWLQRAGHAKPKSIGLGLGLESEDGERTPTEVATKPPSKNEELISFDGAWYGATPEMEAVRGGSDLAHRSELKRRLPKRSQISDHLLETPVVAEASNPSSLTRSLSLRQRGDRDPQTPPRASTEEFAESIPWPLQDDHPELGQKLHKVDDRRFSHISANSTTVEAAIFSTPPSRRKTLRHSSKFTDLNSANLNTEGERHGLDNHSHRRLLRHMRSPNGGQRPSFVLGIHDADDVIPSARKQDTIPVIMIPQRNSSLGPKFPYFQSLRRVKTLTFAASQSSRPTTAPEDAVGYFDLLKRDRRTVSAYVSASPPVEEKQTVPKAPLANVSLDASSATGLKHTPTAYSNGSVGKDSISPPTRRRSQNACRFPETPNAGLASPEGESNGDWSALRPRSSLVTPFSLRSARSSSPGTLEVNEATAISIYPHTNKSILVVQHAPQRNSRPAGHSAIIASNAKFAIPAGSVQPPVIHEPRQLLDSPLQNPRSPPEPPDFKIIPPTPANLTDVSSPDRHQVRPSEQTPRRRLSTRLKQAFSNRRYSDAFVAPIMRPFSLSRRSTVTGARRASTGIDSERNLHPSWRPRAFWDAKDGESDSDSDFGNDGFLVGNSLGMPTEGVKTFDPPKRRASLSRKLGSLRLPGQRRIVSESKPHAGDSYDDEVVPDPTPPRRSDSNRGLGLRHKTTKFYRRSQHDNGSYEFIQPPYAQEGARHGGNNGVPRLGYQVQFVPFRGLADKVKERREEARREKVRERLKGSIDVLRGV